MMAYYVYIITIETNASSTEFVYHSMSYMTLILGLRFQDKTRSQAVARIADRTAKNCNGHVT